MLSQTQLSWAHTMLQECVGWLTGMYVVIICDADMFACITYKLIKHHDEQLEKWQKASDGI
jgi:hypothetical protein